MAISLVIVVIIVSVVTSNKKVSTGDNAVLVVDLSNHFSEIAPTDPLNNILPNNKNRIPSLYDLTRMIRHAKNNSSVKGIYIKCDNNNNNFASSEEIRNVLADFKSSGKFVLAYGNVISQKGYYVASIADKIYCHPTGGLEWQGFAMQIPFIKTTLEKLEIEPQIFYAGKFKDATEPLREKQMSDASRLQSAELLYDIYNYYLIKISEARKIDTSTLHRYADSNAVHFSSQAVALKMVDGVKYDDEIKNEIRQKLRLERKARINFISPGKYAEAVNFKKIGDNKIAVIYAEGAIINGKGDRGQIGGDTYRDYIRNARTDNSIKAIVIRINSGGGSANGKRNNVPRSDACPQSKTGNCKFWRCGGFGWLLHGLRCR